MAKKSVPAKSLALRNFLFLGVVLGAVGILAGDASLFSGNGNVSAQSDTPGSDRVNRMEMSLDAQMQIQSLIDEKNARTPAQQKIDSNLLYAAKMHRGQLITSKVPTLEVNVGEDANGIVTVDISADVSPRLLAILKKMGVEVESSWVQYHTLRAKVSLDKLEEIAALPQVRFIMPKQESTTNHVDRSPIQPSTP